MLKYVRDNRSCQVSSSESHMAHRNPRKNVPAESIYPTLRKSICFAAGGSPEKLTTCKPRNIMPGAFHHFWRNDAGHDVARLRSAKNGEKREVLQIDDRKSRQAQCCVQLVQREVSSQ